MRRQRHWIPASAPRCCATWTTTSATREAGRTRGVCARAPRVERARDQVAAVAGVRRGDVIFTSGATESNNLAILGLAGAAQDRKHVVSTAIEHHAVLEPLAELGRRGFEITLVSPDSRGIVDPDAVAGAVRPDTVLVSIMHVNNETGVRQPVAEIADRLERSDAYLHVDAAQSFARDIDALRHPRIDLISASAHKINGPKGIGALITRRRGQERPPLQPLMFGGGQERGLRPGTMPVALAAGFGLAAELAAAERDERWERCVAFREALLSGLAPLGGIVNGDLAQSVPYIVNLSFPGPRGGGRDRCMERSGRRIERRSMYVAVLHLQPCVERHAPARVEDGGRCAILLVCRDAGAGVECAGGRTAALSKCRTRLRRRERTR